MLANLVQQGWHVINSFMALSIPIGEYKVTLWNMFYFFAFGGLIIGFLGRVATGGRE